MDKKQRTHISSLMKEEEKIAQEYLHTISNDVVPWPSGQNVPPDFKLNQIIAVEVRRLNKHISNKKKKPESLEQERFKLFDALSEVLRTFNASNPTENYRIKLCFSRPIGKISNIKSEAKKELSNFLQDKPQTLFKIKLSDKVSITISKTNRKSTEVFHIGTISDRDGGGWVACDYAENIKYCIKEKTKKIQKYKSKYSEWWLILVDYLSIGIGEPEKTFVIQDVNKGPDWKKIIVINPIIKEEILKID